MMRMMLGFFPQADCVFVILCVLCALELFYTG